MKSWYWIDRVALLLAMLFLSHEGLAQFSQGPKLVGNGSVETGAVGSEQGVPVSQSADGNTAIVGVPLVDNWAGAAWALTAPPATNASDIYAQLDSSTLSGAVQSVDTPRGSITGFSDVAGNVTWKVNNFASTCGTLEYAMFLRDDTSGQYYVCQGNDITAAATYAIKAIAGDQTLTWDCSHAETFTAWYSNGGAFPTPFALDPSHSYYLSLFRNQAAADQFKYYGTSGGDPYVEFTAFAPSDLLAPTPIGPASSSVSTSPTFFWSAVSGATSYRLMVATTAGALSTDPAASTCIGCAINTATSSDYYIPSTPLSVATTYYWQVQASNATQNGTWSTRPTFTTTHIYAQMDSSTLSGSVQSVDTPGCSIIRFSDVAGNVTWKVNNFASTGTLEYAMFLRDGTSGQYYVCQGNDITAAATYAIKAIVGDQTLTWDCSHAETFTAWYSNGGAFPTPFALDPSHSYYLSLFRNQAAADQFKYYGTSGGDPYVEFTASAPSGLLAPMPMGPTSSSVSTSPTFFWSAVSGATSYRLMVATTAGALPTEPASSICGGCAINTSTTTNYHIPSTPLSAATTHYWQVQARSATQNGTWSTRPTFTTAAGGALTITGVSSSPLVGSDSPQTLRVFGSNFQPGMTATLVNTTSGGAPIVKSTSSLTSTQASISAAFTTAAANWTVMVTNPGGSSSGVYSFRVIPPGSQGGDLVARRITIDPISSPETAGSAFAVTVKTVDASGSVLPIDADIHLRTSVGTVNPSFVRVLSGVATAQIKVDSPSCNVHLEATGAGANGSSNEFEVQGAGQGSATGKVMSENGAVIVGATVTVTGCAGSPITATTDISGKYTTPQITAGSYKVIAAYNGKESKTTILNIGANSCTLQNDILIDTVGSPCNPNGLTPILFVPGIMGSTTKFSILPTFPSLPADSPTQESVPPYTPDGRWAPGPARYLDGLYYSHAGGVTEWNVLGAEISLRNAAYRKIVPEDGAFVPNPCLIIPVPYDWRLQPDEAATKYLIPRIKAARAKANSAKVHIVAHSMGGLLARSYIQGADYADDVDRLAMVGTPNEGAEIAYLLTEGGNPIRADIVSAQNANETIFLRVYKNVLEDLYKKSGRDLEAVLPRACRFWSLDFQGCQDLMALPENGAWNRYRREMKRFLSEVSSMRALMPSNRAFLTEGTGQETRGIACGGQQNQFLFALNGPASSSHIDRIGGVVPTKVFAGILENAVDTFTVWSRPGNCSAETLSPDGEYRGFSATNDADGTVRHSSVLASLGVPSSANRQGRHTKLLSVYKSPIADFLFGISSSASGLREADSIPSQVAVVASVSAPNLELRVAGRARPYLLNGSGEGCGLKPGTTETDQTLPGCAAIVAQPLEAALALTGIPNGSYTLTLTSGWAEDSSLSATVDDGAIVTDIGATVFCEAASRNMTVTVAAGTTIPIRIDGAAAPATALTASSAGTPRTASLSWTASTDANVVGYNVYSKRADEPKLALLAQVTDNSHATTDAWADASGVPVRKYAVAARVASGAASVLTEFVANDDRDQDGLTDTDEARYATDADNPDTDGDALRDGDEIAVGSDPVNPDTDGDGFPDGLETSRGSDPLAPESTPVALQPPSNVVATATSTSQVQVSWNAVAGAVSYQVFRSSNHGAYALIGSPTVNGFTDSAVSASTTYLYTVKAIDSAVEASPASNPDLATTIVFTDHPLVVGSTAIKAAHIIELRSAINAVRVAAGLPASVFNVQMATGLPVLATHINELRASLDAARTALGFALQSYPDAVLTGSTSVRAVHLSSLRDGVD
jgi:pimeloyl-ACP methyl ester carboxylesterase